MRFTEDFLDELRFRNDIQSIISPYVSLKSRGRIMVGLCPFHNEKTPSFTVYIDSNSYYCFGCGAGGDCITFIKTAENLDYVEAVKFLADRSGLSLPVDGYDDTIGRVRHRMYEMNRAAARFFYSCLMSKEGRAAQEYVLMRGILPETCKKFGIGFAPNSWDALLKHLKSLGFAEDELIAASLIRKSEKGSCYDVFRNRLIFPVIDLRGNVIAFTGRLFEDGQASAPKYINSPESLIYKKSQVLYGLNIAKNNNDKKLILCEGNMDVIALHQAGFTNAVAAMGTSFTSAHGSLIAKYADEVLLAYDSDAAGQTAILKVINILEKTTVKTKVIKMVGGKDPDEIIKKHGKERMRDILNGAVNDTEFRLMQAAEGLDTSSPDGKLRFTDEAIKIIASLGNPIERDIYITKISSDLDILKEALELRVKSALKQRKKYTDKAKFADVQRQISGHPNITPDEKAHSAKTKLAEETLIRSILQNPDFAKKIENYVKPELFFSDLHKRLYFKIAEKIKNNQKIELSYFAEELSDTEMSVLARLLNDTSALSNTLHECQDCLEALKFEKDKLERPKPSELDDDDIRQLFKK